MTKHLEWVDGNLAKDRLRWRVEPSPECDVQRCHHDGGQGGECADRYGQGRVAAGKVREKVGDVAGRARGYEDHAKCNAGAWLKQMHEQNFAGKVAYVPEIETSRKKVTCPS